MLFLRTRGPRAIRSARPQRAKLTPASVTPANASKFATTPRGPDPRECGSDARAPVSRRLGGPAPGGPALAPLRPWIRPRASAGSSLSRSASLCRARLPSLRKARARFPRVPLRGSRTTRSRIALPDRVCKGFPANFSRFVDSRNASRSSHAFRRTASHKKSLRESETPETVARAIASKMYLENVCASSR